LAVELLKKCTPLWHEAQFNLEVKMLKKLKTPHCMFGALLEVEMLKKYEKVNAIVSQSTF